MITMVRGADMRKTRNIKYQIIWIKTDAIRCSRGRKLNIWRQHITEITAWPINQMTPTILVRNSTVNCLRKPLKASNRNTFQDWLANCLQTINSSNAMINYLLAIGTKIQKIKTISRKNCSQVSSFLMASMKGPSRMQKIFTIRSNSIKSILRAFKTNTFRSNSMTFKANRLETKN